ncbi:MAG: hypothetical protein QM811_09570 [Pirellulales bacterium]
MFDDLASCYDVLGESAVLMREMLPDAQAFPELFNRAMDLAAEAQSALRSAVYRIDGPNDNDQNAVFHWLKAHRFGDAGLHSTLHAPTTRLTRPRPAN